MEVMVMESHSIARRRAWHTLTNEEKQRRLEALRAHHQALIEREARRLPTR